MIAWCGAGCSRDPEAAKHRFLESANRYRDRGLLREASILYRNAIREDGRFGEAYYELGLVQQRLNQRPEAVESLRRAVELLPEGPPRVDARIRLAELLVFYGGGYGISVPLLDEVAHLAAELEKLQPASAPLHRVLGMHALLMAQAASERALPSEVAANLEKARAEFAEADRLSPGESKTLVPLARCYSLERRFDEAEQVLRRLLSSRADPDAYKELFLLQKARGLDHEAEQVLLDGIRKVPANTSLRIQLAQYYESSRQPDKLKEVLAGLRPLAAKEPSLHEVIAAFLLRQGQPEEALREYTNAESQDPDRRAHYRYLATDVLLSLNRRDEAVRKNQSILDEFPQNTDALVRQAQFWFEAGETQRARRELEVILTRHPNHILGQYTLGRVFASLGEPSLAETNFARAVWLAPNFAEAGLALASVQMQVDQFGKAIVTTEEILDRSHGRNPAARLIHAAAVRRIGKTEEAERDLRLVLKENPNSSPALVELGRLRQDQSRLQEAESAFLKSFEADPGNLMGVRAAVDALFANGKTDRALGIVESLLKEDPERSSLRELLAQTAARGGRDARAIAEYRKLLESKGLPEKKKAQAYSGLGESYRRTGDLPTAIKNLELARKLSPDDVEVLHNLAVAYDNAGRKQEAIALYQTVLQRSANNAIALNNLAYHIAESGGDLDQALTYAQRARRLMPDAVQINDTLGWIYLKKNLTDSAIEIFLNLTRKEPEKATYRYHLGAALLQKGDKSGAKRELKAAMACNPGQEDAARIRHLIASLGS